MTYRTSEDHAEQTGPTQRLLHGLNRRVALTRADGTSRWQVLGYRGPAGRETFDVEPFTGIGFFSRPPSSGKPEAIVTAIGGSKTSAIVATRDEATRKAVAGGIDADETILYNSVAVVYVKKTGIVEIRLANGTALPLALKSDVDEAIAKLNAFITAYKIHVHGGVTTGAGISAVPTVVTVSSAAAATGTTVLKGQ